MATFLHRLSGTAGTPPTVNAQTLDGLTPMQLVPFALTSSSVSTTTTGPTPSPLASGPIDVPAGRTGLPQEAEPLGLDVQAALVDLDRDQPVEGFLPGFPDDGKAPTGQRAPVREPRDVRWFQRHSPTIGAGTGPGRHNRSA